MAKDPGSLPRGYPGYGMGNETGVVPVMDGPGCSCAHESLSIAFTMQKLQNPIPEPFGDGRRNSEDAPDGAGATTLKPRQLRLRDAPAMNDKKSNRVETRWNMSWVMQLLASSYTKDGPNYIVLRFLDTPARIFSVFYSTAQLSSLRF